MENPPPPKAIICLNFFNYRYGVEVFKLNKQFKELKLKRREDSVKIKHRFL